MKKQKVAPDPNEHISYEELEERIKGIEGVECISTIKTQKNKFNNSKEKVYNFYKIKQGKGKISVLLSGNVHGYEISGSHALIEFMKNHSKEYLEDFTFTVFPCVNPFGFDNMVHETWQLSEKTGLPMNLNREFKKETTSEEVNLIKSHLQSTPYHLHLDLHESWSTYVAIDPNLDFSGRSPDDFFVYEYCSDPSKRIGHRIVEEVRKAGISICDWELIGNDVNHGGLVYYPEDCKSPWYAEGSSFDGFTFSLGTPNTFTIETALFEDLKDRVKADIISIKTALEEVRKRETTL